MSVKMRKFSLVSASFAVLLLLAAVFSACDSPLGFGDPIDWEPPVLKLDSNRNPRYVGDNTKLEGTVTDNIAVSRVELRYAIPDPDTKEQIKLGEAALSGSNPRSKRWSIALERETFEEWAELLGYEKIDGAKIPVEIVAYDTSGRSGDSSIRAISLIIDLTPPVVENTWVTRTLSTPMRIFYLESLEDLENLAETDPRGEVSGNADKYQNGWFYIDAQLREEETRIEEVRLQVYDTRYDKPLFLAGEYTDENGEVKYRGIERDKKPNDDFGTPVTAPRWLIKEDALIAAGEVNLFPNYRTNYYNNGERYYYEVVISALDMSENEGRWRNSEEGFFIMWEKGDAPKGFLDLVVGGTEDDDPEAGKVTRTKGDLLPVEFFDDDALSWAYTDLFTLDQWRGYKEGGNYTDGPAVYINASNLRMPNGTNEQKLEFLKNQLRNGTTILNWKNDKEGYEADTKKAVTELLGGKTPDEKTAFIQTGSKAGDYGDYVLFTLAGDKKLPPHDPAYTGALNTLKDRWAGGTWDIMLVDDNKPMIIFDTVNKPGKRGSPEENTFPLLDEGRYFTIHGYTLRQCNVGETNKVDALYMAWIPFIGPPGAQAALGTRVVTALEGGTTKPNQGEQYWTLTLTDNPNGGQPEYELIGGVRYRKQYFTKTFDVLGGTAANTAAGVTLANYKDSSPGKILKNETSNSAIVDEAQFIYNNKLENETKLFVFVAVDSTRPDNVVNKQLPILGRITPPKLTVYDISDREVPSGSELSPPDIYDYVGSSGIIDDAARTAYQVALKAYNNDSATFTKMSAIAASGDEPLEEALSLQIYPRGKMLLYWVQAEEGGDLLIKDITMQDTTYSTATPVMIGNYQAAAKRLSFVETQPEVTQRVFLFTATDTLGNEAQIQRTVTITSTAMLTDISTPKPSGTYGISVNTSNIVTPEQDDRITVYTRFSNRIEWEGNNPPLLNVRYKNKDGKYILKQIPTITPKTPATLSLEFRFSVPENALTTGAGEELETMYDNSAMTYDIFDGAGNPEAPFNRPITLPEGTRIVDVSRAGERVSAFIPGYALDGNKMETWRTDKNSLQAKKDIKLDGVRPNLTTVSNNAYLPVSGKAPFTGAGVTGTLYYFKSNETITFTLKADKRIQPSGEGNPRIQFYIGDTNTGGGTIRGPYYAKYERANGTDGMIFTFPLSAAVSPPYADSDNYALRDGVIITNSATATNNIRLNTATEQGGIEDIVGNALSNSVSGGVVQTTSLIPTPVFPANTTVYIDQNAPLAPVTVLTPTTGTAVTFTGASAAASYNVNFIMTINNLTESAGSSPLTKWYSLNGGLTWAEYTAGVPLTNGTHNIVTQYRDRAGNEGLTSTKTVTINVIFPQLLGVSAVEPDGIYNRGKSLSFKLDFADTVSIIMTGAATNLSITLADTTTTQNNGDGTNPSYSITLNRTNAAVATNGKTVTFMWTSVNGKEMLDGLGITAINIAGLRDDFGNTGPATVTPAFNAGVYRLQFGVQTGVETAYNVDYDLAKIIVCGIAPRAISYVPVNANGRTGNVTTSVSSDNKTITIEFSKAMQKGRGTITVRPHGDYAIPAVLENEGYYMSVDLTTGEESKEGQTGYVAANRIYVSGMNDIYNNMTTDQRNTLITSGTLAAPRESIYTGLSYGPYKKMTHGLTEGAGYTGNYNNTNPTVPNAPVKDTGFMIPDTTTKWVLDYQYQIHSTTQTQVTAIRNALTEIGFRRQDIAVTLPNVVISGSTVTITLSEPLLPGLQWDLFYPEGTFTDTAGNSAAALAAGTHWFWSRGAQKPVVRVDRKSYDGRSNDPPTTSQQGAHTQTYAPNGINGTIESYNTINYRIETETPGARIYYTTKEGKTFTQTFAGVTAAQPLGGITGAWTGRTTLDFNTTTTNITSTANITWNGPKTTPTATTGSWVRPNLIFRNNRNTTYTITDNGVATTHDVHSGGNNVNFYGFRSFNKDILKTELNDLTPAATTTEQMLANSFTYTALEASKNYVTAEARVDHVKGNNFAATYTSPRGYEGVFRTVVALNQNGYGTQNVLLCGTNIKSGTPTIAGFPLKDGVHNADTRYLKVFYNGPTNGRTRTFYWVSSEMVTSWFIQQYGTGNGGSYGNAGDSKDWITAGYGDLTYAFDVVSY